MSKGRGHGVGRDAVDRTLRLGRALPAEDAQGGTHIPQAREDKGWVAVGDAALTGPEVRELAPAEEAEWAAPIRKETYVRIAKVRGADPQLGNAGR